ncbi:metacaspase-9 [Cornus florida]|uniref:metacaspase-9 n=1 Tax=Cornus florida TaxID=4283 RepID=UPI0028A1A4D4|nr:metacaspase-9 [Cornus florida]
MENGKKRLAVLVGCNYPNSPNELHGCVNDVVAMGEVLVRRFGFESSHIELLTDAPGSMVMPTGANIKNALGKMVDQAAQGDVLFFHYSGHGTRIPSVRPGHLFRQDEAIVPCDFNLITDVDFRQLVNQLPKGASFTILSDSCHSGGLIEKEKEQIGPSSSYSSSLVLNTSSSSNTTTVSTNCRKPKTIPLEWILQHVTSLTRINTLDIGTHLLELFGSDASLSFRLPIDQQEHLFVLIPKKADVDNGILLSGCQANETSADMSPPMGGGGKAYGAFSNAVQIVLNQNLGRPPPLTNRQVVILARKVLHAQHFDQQHPCLYSSDHNADAIFLCLPPYTSTM